MLSKSQARMFFLTATLGFSGVFLWLTVDTVRQVPERSNEENLTAEVIHGKEIWEANNCMGCHTILGEGAYYAPELTRAYTRRGEAWLKIFLKDPQAMYPGQRKMVQYDFTDEEIDAVIAFLKWVGEIDTNGFPRDPDLKVEGVAQAATPAPSVGPAPPELFSTVCVGCHALGGQGGVVGPALDGVGGRYAEAELRAWLADPQSIKPGTAMPNLNLSASDLDALSAFLMAQK
ncbi:MAG: cytochrome c [Alphaproteobacteria bacterium]|nr:cytochrome c [Alphaproteobacteria bacterium]